MMRLIKPKFWEKNKYYYYNIDTNLFGSVIFSFFKRKVH